MKDKIQNLFDELSEWQKVTFKNQTAIGKSYHLQKESKELTEALEEYYANPCDKTLNAVKMEFADNLLLLFGCASKVGFDLGDIIDFSEEKLEICKGREWNEPDENGVCQHKN